MHIGKRSGFGGVGGGGGGGGGGGKVPTPPAAGLLLTSTGNGPGDYDWEPAGGFQITGYSKTHATTFELGNSDVSPVFSASYSELPTSSQIVYTGGGVTPGTLVLTTPFTSGTIAHTFTSATNGATASFQLQASDGAITRTSTIVDQWGLPFLTEIVPTGSVAATQGFLDALRAASGAQIHTANAGTYLAGQSVTAGDVSAFGLPSALPTPTFKDKNGLVTSPVVVGAVAGYVNPFGITIPMLVYTVGGVGIGTVSWSLS